MENIIFYKENNSNINDYVEISNGNGKSIIIKLTNKKYSSFPIKIDKHISAMIVPYAMYNNDEINEIFSSKGIKIIIPTCEINIINEISFWSDKIKKIDNMEQNIINIQNIDNNKSTNIYNFKITYYNVDYYNTFLIEINNKKYFYFGNYDFFNYKYSDILKNKIITNIDYLISSEKINDIDSNDCNNDFDILRRLKSKCRKNKPICLFFSMFNIENFINILNICSNLKKYLVIDFYTYSIVEMIFFQNKRLKKILKKNKKIMKIIATDNQYDKIKESNFINFSRRAKLRQLQKSNKIIFKIENEEINKNINKYIFLINENYIKDIENYDINVNNAEFIYYMPKNYKECNINIENFINKHKMLVSHIYTPNYIRNSEINKLINYTHSKILQ